MARSFNGSSKISANGANAFTAWAQPLSVSAWLLAASSVTNAVYYGEGSSSSTQPMVQLQVNSGKFRFYYRRDGNGGTSDVNGVTSTTTCADGTWHHVVYGQNNAGNWQVYIDGVADATAQGSYPISGRTITVNEVTFGALTRTTTSNYFTGKLEEVASWSRQLSASEVVSLASGLPASHLGPDHYWPLFGIDSPEPDIGNTNRTTGTLTGTSYANGALVSDNLITV